MHRILTTLPTLLAASLFASHAGAQEAHNDPAEHFGRGVVNAGISAGWGHGFETTQEQDLVRMAAVVPRLGVGLTDPLGGDAWYRGSVDLALEPQFLFETDGGFAGGGALLLRYHFLRGERLVPFLSVGGGMVGIDFDGRHQDDGFNFILQAGTGAHWLLDDRTALTVDARYHHMSNAFIRDPNHGIDSALLMLGVTWFSE